MHFKKELNKYSLISNGKKGFQLNFSGETRLKFKIGKRESFQPTNYQGKKSVDLYFYDDNLKNINKWYIVNIQNGQLFIKKEILGVFDHISLHDLKGNSSQTQAGQRRLYNFHYLDEKNSKNKVEVSGNQNNFNDMGLFHIMRAGKKYGLFKKYTIVEQIHFMQNFDSERFFANILNQVFDESNNLDKEIIIFLKRIHDDIEFRKYFYSFKTKLEIKEFEAVLGTQTFENKINKFDENFKILEINDTRYSVLLHFEKLYDPNTAYFGVKAKMIQAKICNNKTNSFCILGHLESQFEDNEIVIGCF